MATSHLDRKELKRPDAFLEKAGSIIDFVNENSKGFVAGLVLVFVAGLGFAFYTNHHEKEELAANSALYNAKKTLLTALEKAPKAGADWDKDLRSQIAGAEKVAAEFAGTKAAFEANLILGDAYFDHGEPAKAIDYYKAATNVGRPKTLKALALLSLSYAYENAKRPDDAVAALQSAIATGDKAVRAEALLALGRNLEIKGDKPRALEQYELVAREFPGSALARTAEIQRAQLR
jgi:predicted negative regulator of RcsB-dependent stress response